MLNDFNYGILDVTAHRPWPMPSAPWIMTQTWHDLLFMHWAIDVETLRAKVPAGFEIDCFQNQAWLGIVPFHMGNVAPRGVPALPWISAFPELNVRTYVRVRGTPGVYFFSLDAANPVAVAVARALAHLPYFSALMKVEVRDGWIHFSSRRKGSSGTRRPGSGARDLDGIDRRAELVGRYRPVGDVRPPAQGTLEYFLTERYCLFTVAHDDRAYRVDIHHPPWPLQSAEAELTVNTMAGAAGIRLPAVAPLLHFARRQDTVAWNPVRV